MKTLYLDLFSGISGDMFLGALIDLGVDVRRLERELKKLKLRGWRLEVSRQIKGGLAGVKLDVVVNEPGAPARVSPAAPHPPDRTFGQIRHLITRSRLSPWVKQRSVATFRRLAEAEGQIHGVPIEEVHFHEIGAADSIVDIVGACVALEMLGKPRVRASPVVEGIGWVDCAHGRLPLPAPATLAILGARGIGITQCDEPQELVTPTGAALLAEFVEHFGPMNHLVAGKIGLGLGTRENRTRPNVLRAILGDEEIAPGAARNAPPASRPPDWETDTIAVLETNLDDCSGEILGAFVKMALAAGALDVFHTPVQMKKNRPGVLLTVLCAEADADRLSELMLRETTAFGVRKTIAERRKLRREFADLQTPFGKVTVKIGRWGDKVIQAAPEFESCRELAERTQAPLKQIYAAALQSAQQIK
jgi:uncharacterized protein (TIGR00299 family) protein